MSRQSAYLQAETEAWAEIDAAGLGRLHHWSEGLSDGYRIQTALLYIACTTPDLQPGDRARIQFHAAQDEMFDLSPAVLVIRSHHKINRQGRPYRQEGVVSGRTRTDLPTTRADWRDSSWAIRQFLSPGADPRLFDAVPLFVPHHEHKDVLPTPTAHERMAWLRIRADLLAIAKIRRAAFTRHLGRIAETEPAGQSPTE